MRGPGPRQPAAACCDALLRYCFCALAAVLVTRKVYGASSTSRSPDGRLEMTAVNVLWDEHLVNGCEISVPLNRYR